MLRKNYRRKVLYETITDLVEIFYFLHQNTQVLNP